MAQFDVAIIKQGWLGGLDPMHDLCSHGTIRLQIGDVLISDGTRDYGISQSARALLRTLVHNHTPDDDPHDRLIYHGCGGMFDAGCYIGIDWQVSHDGDRVHLSNVVRYDDNSGAAPIAFPDAVAAIPRATYVSAIVPFALQARKLFEHSQKVYAESEVYHGEFRDFWNEFDDLLHQHGVETLQSIAF